MGRTRQRFSLPQPRSVPYGGRAGFADIRSINDELPSSFSDYWTSAFGQDTWRLGRVTVNAGLRFEYETGVRETNGHMIVGWDPNAKTAIRPARPPAC